MPITSDFAKFSPQAYLKEQFSDNGCGYVNTTYYASLIKEYNDLKATDIILEIGGGPTIYQLVIPAKTALEIYFSEFLKSNREEVSKWLSASPSAWNWDGHIKRILFLEGGKNPTKKEIEERKKLIRQKTRHVIFCDAREQNPLIDDKYIFFFDYISLNCCIDSITDNLNQWRDYLRNCLKLLKPRGKIIYNSICDVEKGWDVGKVSFPGIDIQPEQLTLEMNKAGVKLIYLDKIPNNECIGHHAHLFSVGIKN